jgi:hypothetical protein
VAFKAVIYEGQPVEEAVQNWCQTEGRIYHHNILHGNKWAF